MPGMIRLNTKEANVLVDEIERRGGDADSLKVAINDEKDGHSSISAGKVSDEEYLAEKRAQTEIEKGTDLECMVCHQKFDELISGTCEACFREWMLPLKPEG